jgi:hypothetical protein
MSRVTPADPFGSLAAFADGTVVPELTSAIWDGRDNVDRTLPWVLAMVRASGLPAWWDENIALEKQRRNPNTVQGRPREVSGDAVLVGWLMCKTTRRSLLHTEIARFLLHTINAEQRALLGVPPVQGDPTSASDGHRGLLDKKAVARRIGRLVTQMIEVVDPSPHQQARSRTKGDVVLRKVTPEQRADAAARLDWAVTQIVTMPVKAMPRWLRRQWTGDAAVDGTHVRLASKGATRDKAAWDADGGWYVRAKATGDRHAPKSQGGQGAKVMKVTKSAYALDLALVIACDATEGDRQYFPSLPLTLVAHKPSADSIGHATRAFGVLAQAGVAKRYMAADRLYPHEGGADWHVGLQEQGWQPVFDYRVDTLGRQGVAKGGLLLVEGQFHCPMTPDAAIEATADLRAGRIDHATYKARLAQRDLHRLHLKEGEDANGTVRFSCPASGPSPKVRCPKRPDSMKPHVIRQPDGTDGDTRTLVQLLPTRLAEVAEAEALTATADKDVPDAARAKMAAAARKSAQGPSACDPKICKQDSVSVRREVLAKHRQALVYGSPEHKAVYRAARNAQEGLHGFAKDDAQEAVGNPGLRRKRGLAAQSLYAAVGFAVASLRKIVSFIEHARQDAQGRWYVPRNPRPSQYDDVALGAGGGYRDDDDGLWVPPEDDTPPDVAV